MEKISWFEVWIDGDAGDICLLRSDSRYSIDLSFSPFLWEAEGCALLGGNLVFVPNWIECRLDGERLWWEQVPEKVLKEREKVQGAEEARRQSRPDDVT